MIVASGRLHLPTAVELPWLVLMVYWFIGVFRVRKTKRSDSRPFMLLVRLAIIAAMIYLFGPWGDGTVLSARFIPRSQAVRDIGIAVTWAGVGVAIWARYHLGEYWSARVTIKEDHKLIASGPYAYMRHPIYSGILLGMVGTALAIGEWRAILIIVLFAILYLSKATREEALLRQEFGDSFEEYRRQRGFLLPHFR